MNIINLAQYLYANSLPVREVNGPPQTSCEHGTIIVNDSIAIVLQDKDKATVIYLGKKHTKQLPVDTSYLGVVASVKSLLPPRGTMSPGPMSHS